MVKGFFKKRKGKVKVQFWIVAPLVGKEGRRSNQAGAHRGLLFPKPVVGTNLLLFFEVCTHYFAYVKCIIINIFLKSFRGRENQKVFFKDAETDSAGQHNISKNFKCISQFQSDYSACRENIKLI